MNHSRASEMRLTPIERYLLDIGTEDIVERVIEWMLEQATDPNASQPMPPLPPRWRIKEAIERAVQAIKALPTRRYRATFGSPSFGDGRSGFRVDPPHYDHGKPWQHVDWWFGGKRTHGGKKGCIPIRQAEGES